MATSTLERKQQKPDLSIIIVAYNVKDLVAKCLGCIEKSRDRLNKEIIYVDNGSSDGTFEMVQREFPEVTLIRTPVNLGFVLANNLGYQSTKGRHILMLNSDAFVRENTLQKLNDFMEQHPDCGALGCRAINGQGKLLPSGRNFPTPWRLFVSKMGLAGKIPFVKDINDLTLSDGSLKECDWVTGCCLLTRKEIVDSMDCFLRPELFMYNDDNDLCLRIRKKGWKVYCHPETITHLSGVNNEKVAQDQKKKELLEQLSTESEFVYFRHNYGMLLVLLHYLFILFYEGIQIVKNILFLRGKEKIAESFGRVRRTTQLLVQTNFGKMPVARDFSQDNPKTSARNRQ